MTDLVRWLAAALCLALITGLTSGCMFLMKPAGSEQETTAPPEQTFDGDRDRLDEELRSALAYYRNGEYALAGRLFHHIAETTEHADLHGWAKLGANLSELLAAENPQQTQQLLKDWEQFSKQAEDVFLPPDFFLLEPFLDLLVRDNAKDEQIQALVTELSLTIDKVRASDDEIDMLREKIVEMEKKIMELEALFNLLEQKKRQLIEQ